MGRSSRKVKFKGSSSHLSWIVHDFWMVKCRVCCWLCAKCQKNIWSQRSRWWCWVGWAWRAWSYPSCSSRFLCPSFTFDFLVQCFFDSNAGKHRLSAIIDDPFFGHKKTTNTNNRNNYPKGANKIPNETSWPRFGVASRMIWRFDLPTDKDFGMSA